MINTRIELPKTPLDSHIVLRLFRRAHSVLRDTISGGIMERFDELVKLLILKVFDENEVISGKKDTKEFCRYILESKEKTYDRIMSLHGRIVNQHPEYFPERFRTLQSNMDAIANIAEIWGESWFSTSLHDLKGSAFQDFLKDTFDKNDNQQFFTPPEVVDFMTEIAISCIQRPLSEVTICDPACGTGGLLLGLLKHGLKECNFNASNCIFGADVDERMAWLTSINIFLTSGYKGNIYHTVGLGGSLDKNLESLQSNFFDLVITNPPFGSDVTSEEILQQYQLGKYKLSRRRSILFVERCLELLKPDGHLVIVLDDSVLNQPSTEDVRELVHQYGLVKAVFSLPDTAFLPYAAVKASIVVVQKKAAKTDEQLHILMSEINQTGRKPNGMPLYKNERINGKLVLDNDMPLVSANFYNFINCRPINEQENITTFVVTKAELQEAAKEDRLDSWKRSRLDVIRYHPVSKFAKVLLHRSNYPIYSLDELVEFRAERLTPCETPDETFRYIGLANIEKMTGEWNVEEVLGDTIKSSCNVFKPNDIIFARMRPNLRKVILIPEDDIGGICSSECAVMYIKEEKRAEISLKFLEWMLRSDLVFGQLIGKVTGIGRPRITNKHLQNLKLPLPPIEEQEKIASKLEASKRNAMQLREMLAKKIQDAENQFLTEARSLQGLYE